MATHWHEMEIFKGIDLNDSFVLSWGLDDNQLTFSVEASIWPESPYYDTPKSNEYACYKKALLSFQGIRQVAGLKPMTEVRPSVDANGEEDYGNIDSLAQTMTGYDITGEFGHVIVNGGHLEFHIIENV